ncbi:hypothetical protein [Deinococcus navajonensis]|uniref:Uncharacterized protein n=1 Tax=Deinococcus navajonensis TaxID=309884 RepID=A0ABV8XHH6_9DEIO
MRIRRSVPFEVGNVSAALLHEGALYVRGTDRLAAVSPAGDVTALHTFGPQRPLASAPLVQVGDRLLSVDHPPGGRALVTATKIGGATTARCPAPEGSVDLVVAGSEVWALGHAAPATTLARWGPARYTPLAQARGLGHWRTEGDALLWCDQGGLHRLTARGQDTLRGGPVLAFSAALDLARPEVTDEPPAVRIETGVGHTVVGGVNRPVRFLSTAAGRFVRFRDQIAPLEHLNTLTRLPEAQDLGTVLEVAGGLAYVDDQRRVRWSPDGQEWAALDLPGSWSEIVAAGPQFLVATSRRASVWLEFAS